MNTNKKYTGIKQMEQTPRDRQQIIMDLMTEYNLTTLLELGTQTGVTAKTITDAIVTGVDISNKNSQYYTDFFHGTTDRFFEKVDKKYDVIFIDASHKYEDVKKDFLNSVGRAKFIVMHDVWPDNLEYTKPEWCGTVYKLAYQIIMSGFKYSITRDDHGVMVIDMRDNSAELTCTEDITYEDYVKQASYGFDTVALNLAEKAIENNVIEEPVAPVPHEGADKSVKKKRASGKRKPKNG